VDDGEKERTFRAPTSRIFQALAFTPILFTGSRGALARYAANETIAAAGGEKWQFVYAEPRPFVPCSI